MTTSTLTGWDPAVVARWHVQGATGEQLASIVTQYPTPDEFLATRSNVRPQSRDPLPLPPGGFVLLRGTPTYPAQLAESPSAPILLYGVGDVAALAAGVAVVGTRQMSAYGQAVVDSAVTGASQARISTVSNLTDGCGREAAEASLTDGVPHVAVVTSSPDELSPAGRADLARRVVDAGGAIVSAEPFGVSNTADRIGGYRPGTLQRRQAARDRMVAALSVAVVFAEGRVGSASLRTVWATLGAGRPLLVAMPRAHARDWPGAAAPIALAASGGRRRDQLRALGMPTALIDRWEPGRMLASGVAEGREQLALMVKLTAWLSVHRARREAAESPVAA